MPDTDPLAEVLDNAATELVDLRGEPEGVPMDEMWAHLARVAREYFVSRIEDEIEDVERYGDGGLPPTSAGLKRAIGIINRGAK